jgi:dihydrofolate synthase/folylpolyglutamate synthase
MWDYADALSWLYGRQALGIKLGLDKVRALLLAVGDPHARFSTVHVAGTNGKGSVCHFVAGALQRSGHRTALYTSPHLVRFAERIRVDGEPISERDVARLLDDLRAPVAALDARGEPPTFFEVATVLGFLWFAEQQVDWAVIETGMGGRLDATSVIAPALTVITNVTRDHEQFLGRTTEAVANEKAGIMKAGVPCVTACTGVALRVLKERSVELHVPMSVVGEDYVVAPADVGSEGESRGPATFLRLHHPGGEARYRLRALGSHQHENAAVAVAACDALRAQGVHLPLEAVQHALRNVRVPGRLEWFDRNGARVLIDGAHNEAGAQALRWHMGKTDLAGFDLVVGFNRDKDWAAMLAQWTPLAARVWAVPLRSTRSLDPEEMRVWMPEHVAFGTRPSVRDALDAARAAGADTIIVAGSLWLVGEARAVLSGESLEEVRGAQ